MNNSKICLLCWLPQTCLAASSRLKLSFTIRAWDTINSLRMEYNFSVSDYYDFPTSSSQYQNYVFIPTTSSASLINLLLHHFNFVNKFSLLISKNNTHAFLLLNLMLFQSFTIKISFNLDCNCGVILKSRLRI